MTDESLPVTFADPETAMGDLHVPTRVIHRATSRRAQEIDEQLLLAAHTILTTVLPKPRKLLICLQAGQKVIGNGCDRIVSAQPWSIRMVGPSPSSRYSMARFSTIVRILISRLPTGWQPPATVS